MDNVGGTILEKLKGYSLFYRIHFHLIPSHVDIEENETEDTLSKAGACDALSPPASLTYSEIFSSVKC